MLPTRIIGRTITTNPPLIGHPYASPSFHLILQYFPVSADLYQYVFGESYNKLKYGREYQLQFGVRVELEAGSTVVSMVVAIIICSPM
jgi:hypothetical protein